MLFDYKARDGAGRAVNGQLNAADQDSAAGQLLRDGMTPVSITVAKQKKSASDNRNIDLKHLLRPAITHEDRVMLCRQMYSLLQAGVPLFQAVSGLSRSSPNDRLRETLEQVLSHMQSGHPLSAGLAEHPKVFSDMFINMVRVGESTGQLDAVFLQLAGYFEREMETKKRISAAMRYPMFVVFAVVLALIAMNIFVIPAFSGMFTKLGAELPWTTRALIASSDFFLRFWPLMLTALVVALGGFKFSLRTERGLLAWDRTKTRIPLVGDIIHRSLLARYGRTFSMMLRAGVPLVQALVLCADAMDNSWMGKRIRGMRDSIERGESLLSASTNTKLFTPLVLQMIGVGEQTGQVDQLLEETAQYYEREVDYDLKKLTARLEPILLAIVSGLVLILALGIFTPMWDLMGAMRG